MKTFTERLAVARHLVAAPAHRDLPGHVADQMQAAAQEAAGFNARLFATVQGLFPARGWQARQADASDSQRAHLLAALLAASKTQCPHLRRGGPQPLVVRLPLRRMDCTRCLGTLRKPPAADDDRCDLCERKGVQRFVPFAVTTGPTTILGDVCSACAEVLGIGERAA